MKFGLIGEKLGHSLSPRIHKELFSRLGLTASYELLEMSAAQLPLHLERLRQEYTGVNVTIPHKITVMQYLDSISPEAKAIGAVNTIAFQEGKARGYNTDYFGFGRMLKHYDLVPTGKDVCVLGTGGAARSVLQYLTDCQSRSISVITRDTIKAAPDLQQRFSLKTYEELPALQGDLLINCTPVGMFPKIEGSPVDASVMEHFAAAADLIYNPAITRFLSLAQHQKKPAVNGLFMLVAQAVAAEEIWLGRKFDETFLASLTEKIAAEGKENNRKIDSIGE